MKTFARLMAGLMVLVAVQGCRPDPREANGPTEEFQGQVVHNGEPVSFGPEEEAKLQVVRHGNGERFGVPLKEDGTFDVEWMPVDTYTVMLERLKPQEGGRSAIPMTEELSPLVIEEGKQDYQLELGEDWEQ